MKNFTRLFLLKTLLIICLLQLLFVAGLAQISVVSGGVGQTNDITYNAENGGNATGLGCGGGGANHNGGDGGDGMYGGGGGGAAGYSAINMKGGKGGQGVVVVAFYSGMSFVNTIVYNNGSSFIVGPLITSVKIWAIGAGGGGAGATNNDATVGGGGGGGGTAYITKNVTPGDIIYYSLGTAGAGGIDANNGTAGGNTTVTIAATTISGNGGSGGQYNNTLFAAGGSYSGGDGGSYGGDGTGSIGDKGGCAGGGIGTCVVCSSAPILVNGEGADGADAFDIDGLFDALSFGALLPVKWETVTVTPLQNKTALLQWKTSYEFNTVSFTIQASSDGINFKPIATIPASNNPRGKAYEYIHQNPLPGVTYYRLMQTDANGKYWYSVIVKNTLNVSKEKDVVMAGNIINNGFINIQVNKSTTVSLLNVEGQVFYSRQMDKGWNKIDVSRFAKGIYILRSTTESEKVLIQ